MNKRGVFTNFIFGLLGLFIIILVLTTLIPVQKGSITLNESISALDKVQNNTANNFIIKESQGPIVRVVYKFVDFIVYTAIEISKAAVRWGSENLDTSAYLLLWVVMLSLLAPIVVAFVKLGAITFIFVRDLFQSRREKRELFNLRQDEQKRIKKSL